MMFLGCGYDLISLYIGLELMALTFYVLVAFTKRERRSNEAGDEVLSAGRVFVGHSAVRHVVAVRHGGLDEPRRDRLADEALASSAGT